MTLQTTGRRGGGQPASWNSYSPICGLLSSEDLPHYEDCQQFFLGGWAAVTLTGSEMVPAGSDRSKSNQEKRPWLSIQQWPPQDPLQNSWHEAGRGGESPAFLHFCCCFFVSAIVPSYRRKVYLPATSQFYGCLAAQNYANIQGVGGVSRWPDACQVCARFWVQSSVHTHTQAHTRSTKFPKC